MGMLVNGTWRDEGYQTEKTGGRFKRWESGFRDFVSADGSTGYAAEAGRYHLYVSLACPWAHRTLIFRKLKKLEDIIDVTVVDALMLEKGWVLPDGSPLYELYRKAAPDYSGRVTVPVLWDKKTNGIVNNESSEIIRMLNSQFNAFGDETVDFYPEGLRSEIDAINADVYNHINNGVYKTGFATTQEAYEEAYGALFGALDGIEKRLSRQRFLVANTLTEADWRLFTTLVRFDAVYVGHFKCNRNRIADYPNLSAYLRDLYQVPGVAETVNMENIKTHYYASHRSINPTGIVPMGPELEFDRPHGREKM